MEILANDGLSNGGLFFANSLCNKELASAKLGKY